MVTFSRRRIFAAPVESMQYKIFRFQRTRYILTLGRLSVEIACQRPTTFGAQKPDNDRRHRKRIGTGQD